MAKRGLPRADSHAGKVLAAEKAIAELHSDHSVPMDETINDLRGLKDDIQVRIEALHQDKRRAAKILDQGGSW